MQKTENKSLLEIVRKRKQTLNQNSFKNKKDTTVQGKPIKRKRFKKIKKNNLTLSLSVSLKTTEGSSTVVFSLCLN